MTCWQQILTICGKHIMRWSSASKLMSRKWRSISSSCINVALFEALSRVQCLTWNIIILGHGDMVVKECTFAVISARSSSRMMVSAIDLPSWLPRRQWKARRAAFNMRLPVVGSLAIQCAVMQRYDWRLWSGRKADAASWLLCPVSIKVSVYILYNGTYHKFLLKPLEPCLPCLDNGLTNLCAMWDILVL